MPRRLASLDPSPCLLLSLTSLFWSVNWVIGKAIVGQVSPLALTFIRWLVAVAVILPFAWPSIRSNWPVIRRHAKLIAWLGFWGTGLHYTTATNGVIFNSAIPVFIVMLGWLIYRDTITRVQALGIAISMSGVFAILTGGDPDVLAQLSLNKGDLIVLSGMIFWAAYTVFLRLKPAELPGLALLACCACVGVVLLLPLFLLEMALFDGHVSFTPATVGAMLYVGIFPSFIGYVFWNRAVSQVGSNVAGIFVHLMPAFGSLLAWLFLDEAIRLYHLAGIALILAGITLTSRGPRSLPAAGPE